jgi:acyl-CoA reductase-like NAD-dependent aldehyde dehydrogenase
VVQAVETDTAAQECYEASALASHALGEIIPSAQPRLSLARRVPVGVVGVVSFTGSTAAGRRVGELAGRQLKRAHLELGGNSALIVLDDADLELAVSAGAWGSFLHQGQICMTTGRHLVHESVAAQYVAAPFGGVGASGTGSRFGGATANLEAFTETQWLTIQGTITQYPF